MTAVRRLPIVAEDRPGVVRVRARTESMHRLSQRALRAGAEAYPEQPGVDYLRPKTFTECERAGLGDTTPCPFASCRYNLTHDVNPRTGSIKENRPGAEVEDYPDTCTLRVANEGGRTLEQVAAAMNLTRERIRQLESRALAKVRASLGEAGLGIDDLSAFIDASKRENSHGGSAGAGGRTPSSAQYIRAEIRKGRGKL